MFKKWVVAAMFAWIAFFPHEGRADKGNLISKQPRPLEDKQREVFYSKIDPFMKAHSNEGTVSLKIRRLNPKASYALLASYLGEAEQQFCGIIKANQRGLPIIEVAGEFFDADSYTLPLKALKKGEPLFLTLLETSSRTKAAELELVPIPIEALGEGKRAVRVVMADKEGSSYNAAISGMTPNSEGVATVGDASFRIAFNGAGEGFVQLPAPKEEGSLFTLKELATGELIELAYP